MGDVNALPPVIGFFHAGSLPNNMCRQTINNEQRNAKEKQHPTSVSCILSACGHVPSQHVMLARPPINNEQRNGKEKQHPTSVSCNHSASGHVPSQHAMLQACKLFLSQLRGGSCFALAFTLLFSSLSASPFCVGVRCCTQPPLIILFNTAGGRIRLY